MQLKVAHQVTILFTTVGDFLQSQPAWSQWRKSPNKSPRFSDAEVITVALMQGCLKVTTLKHAYLIIATDFAPAFPRLPSYCQFMARLHTLQPIVGRLIQFVLPKLEDDIYLMDSKPIPVSRAERSSDGGCKIARHGRVRLLREDGAYSGKNSCGWSEQNKFCSLWFQITRHCPPHGDNLMCVSDAR